VIRDPRADRPTAGQEARLRAALASALGARRQQDGALARAALHAVRSAQSRRVLRAVQTWVVVLVLVTGVLTLARVGLGGWSARDGFVVLRGAGDVLQFLTALAALVQVVLTRRGRARRRDQQRGAGHARRRT
jgi:hypothetical protein